MPTPRSVGYRGDERLSGRLGKFEEDQRQLRERIGRQQKREKPQTGTIGTAVLTSQSGSVVPNGNELDFGLLQFTGPTDAYGNASEPVSSWCSTNYGYITLAEGWYDLSVSLSLAWADASRAPDYLYTLMSVAGGSPPYNNSHYHHAITVDSRKGIELSIGYGHVYSNGATDGVVLEVNYPVTAGVADPYVSLSVGSSPYVIWTVTRLA